MNPKSPQSSPVKRAKRARLMWAVLEADCPIELHVEEAIADMSVDGSEHAGIAASKMPVHVLDASEAAHEQRVEAGAKAIYMESYDPMKIPAPIRKLRAPLPTWEQIVTESPENVIVFNCRAKATACLASVYSAPAGKARAKL